MISSLVSRPFHVFNVTQEKSCKMLKQTGRPPGYEARIPIIICCLRWTIICVYISTPCTDLPISSQIGVDPKREGGKWEGEEWRERDSNDTTVYTNQSRCDWLLTIQVHEEASFEDILCSFNFSLRHTMAKTHPVHLEGRGGTKGQLDIHFHLSIIYTQAHHSFCRLKKKSSMVILSATI